MGLGIHIKGDIKKPLLSFSKTIIGLPEIQASILRNTSGYFLELLNFTQDETTPLSVRQKPIVSAPAIMRTW